MMNFDDILIKERDSLVLARPVISRDDIISQAVNDCLDLMYRASYPSITLKELNEQYKELPEDKRGEVRLYEAHYLPNKIYTSILEDFREAYEFKSDLPEIIEILKNYFKEPIVDEWIKGEDDSDPGHRGYTHPEPMSEEAYKEAEKFMDMANNFFNWNRDLNTFNFNVMNYSPCSNRETVERWWHEHGNPDFKFKLPPDEYWTDTWEEEDE